MLETLIKTLLQQPTNSWLQVNYVMSDSLSSIQRDNVRFYWEKIYLYIDDMDNLANIENIEIENFNEIENISMKFSHYCYLNTKRKIFTL